MGSGVTLDLRSPTNLSPDVSPGTGWIRHEVPPERLDRRIVCDSGKCEISTPVSGGGGQHQTFEYLGYFDIKRVAFERLDRRWGGKGLGFRIQVFSFSALCYHS